MNTGLSLGGLQLELLCLIANKYEPDVSALQDDYGRWHDTSIPYQSIYQALERLDDRGLVEKKPIDGHANCYMLTTEGAKRLAKHREFVLDHTDAIDEALD